jgi:hypothetical protein
MIVKEKGVVDRLKNSSKPPFQPSFTQELSDSASQGIEVD